MTARVLNSAAGVTPEIGSYLAGMEEVREQLTDAVSNLPLEKVSRLALPEAHSIGALVMHIGEAEWYWMQCVVSGRKLKKRMENLSGTCLKARKVFARRIIWEGFA